MRRQALQEGSSRAGGVPVTASAEGARGPDPRSRLAPDAVRGAARERLSSVRCYNYRTQLAVAGRLVAECLAAGHANVLVLDKSVESALETFETLGVGLRAALQEGRLEVCSFRRGARDRIFFRHDYEALLDEALRRYGERTRQVTMIEFDTLFERTLGAAIENQIADFRQVIDERDVAVCGLYSPASWSRDDVFRECLSSALGEEAVREARPGEEGGSVTLELRRTGVDGGGRARGSGFEGGTPEPDSAAA